MPTRRIVALCLVPVVIAIGLATRRAPVLAEGVGAHVGDALWAVMAYVAWTTLLPGRRPVAIAALALATAWAVETSQLLSISWLDDLRATRLGALALGRGFDPVDLLAYAVGVGTACAIDVALGRRAAAADRAGTPPPA